MGVAVYMFSKTETVKYYYLNLEKGINLLIECSGFEKLFICIPTISLYIIRTFIIFHFYTIYLA